MEAQYIPAMRTPEAVLERKRDVKCAKLRLTPRTSSGPP
jgi:hypothetical protein